MIPRSKERDVLLLTAQQLTRVEPGGRAVGLSFRALAAHSQVGIGKAQLTLRDMARAGELQVVGKGREPGANRPVNLYAAAPIAGRGSAGGADPLGGVLRGWVAAA